MRPKTNNKCQIVGCEEKHYAKMYCYKHYGRFIARPRSKLRHLKEYKKIVMLKSEKFEEIYGLETINSPAESKNNIPLGVLYPEWRKLPRLITV